ncbi:odorant receptor coreceptor [Ctenocephalides felis]|uniref:odorant receptor coreceptor n=1 Tax=Ctenocephalides felis TaxID=7515 RepID=UPI000E6E38A2|nr:odorant receptor coreceptor [Ctenocephalides felis]
MCDPLLISEQMFAALTSEIGTCALIIIDQGQKNSYKTFFERMVYKFFNSARMSDTVKYAGLVADLLPNARLMQFAGLFLFRYSNQSTVQLRRAYALVHLFLLIMQYGSLFANLATHTGDVAELTANTITVLFFLHPITKNIYFAVNSASFYRTWGIWNQSNSHPLFAESNARYHSIALAKMRRLLVAVVITSLLSVAAWTTLTFFGDSTRTVMDMETNETMTEPVPRLMLRAWYPWPSMSGPMYMISFGLQLYYLTFSLLQSNLLDVLFCSWLIFACEQLQHLKGIMRPLMELSSVLDTYRPDSAALFRTTSANSQTELIPNDDNDVKDIDAAAIYNSKADWGAHYRGPSVLQNFNQGANNPNGLTKKQEMMVRSAIKYWVERHKHVVRLVAGIGDTYGGALLLHMLTSTITLTLLAYQATKIDRLNVFAFGVIGYLVYSLAQVFLFCVFGNRLIEESSSVMEAAYSCHWYDGSEEAKTFVQIVCQQCQKAMTISGAKFFTVSLDLFASVLGAVVTYFMVLVQLK